MCGKDWKGLEGLHWNNIRNFWSWEYLGSWARVRGHSELTRAMLTKGKEEPGSRKPLQGSAECGHLE
jgi:hypothetical protein